MIWILISVIEEIAADFETAIEQTGYGKFNILLLLIALPCCASSVFETTAMSLILPSAECSLHLSLVNKGSLNAITYCGKWIKKSNVTHLFQEKKWKSSTNVTWSRKKGDSSKFPSCKWLYYFEPSVHTVLPFFEYLI